MCLAVLLKPICLTRAYLWLDHAADFENTPRESETARYLAGYQVMSL